VTTLASGVVYFFYVAASGIGFSGGWDFCIRNSVEYSAQTMILFLYSSSWSLLEGAVQAS
jgi:hypothetical protein